MKLLICCNNIPDTVGEILTELGKEYQCLPIGANYSKKYKHEILMVLTFHEFKQNIKVFNSSLYENKTVILFCPIVQTSLYPRNIATPYK